MAKSRFEYVKQFERNDELLQNTYIIVRIDGHAFHRFSDSHAFTKPNDKRALDLMDAAAKQVFQDLGGDVMMAFGESDEYSFLIRRGAKLYRRRESKILSLLVSIFTSSYVFLWPQFFPDKALQYPPTFDGRVVLYPSEKEVRDYFSWRQADTHINNLNNTAFWALIQQGGQSIKEAHKTLHGTFSSDKNEILFSRFGINYTNLPAQFRKGSVLIRQKSSAQADEQDVEEPQDEESEAQSPSPSASTDPELVQDVVADVTIDLSSTSTCKSGINPKTGLKGEKKKKKAKAEVRYDGTSGDVVVLHEDIIQKRFWEERPWILA